MAPLALLTCEAPTAPGVCGTIPEQTITVGEVATVMACFEDRDRAALSYKSWVSDPGVATISGSNGTVTATAVSPGNALVTIVADNQYGLKAQQSFRVMVPNRPPVVLVDIEDREVAVGDAETLDVSGHFSEPDGQTLVYAAEADPGYVIASVAGAALTVEAAAKGTMPVKVTATDPGGMTATLSFMVTVPNQPPLPMEAVGARTVEVGDTTRVDMVSLFMDPDGDALTYAVVASDVGVVEVAMLESALLLMAAAKGEATVTVTATDPEGLTAEQSFVVTVPNQPPMAVGPIPSQAVTIGDSATLDLTPFFDDPDGDALTFSARAADGTVSVSVLEGRVMLVPARKGKTTVTVTATDTDGVSVTQKFAVTVPNSAPEALGAIDEWTLRVDSAAWLNAAPYFVDPDGDDLVYTAATSDPDVATVAVVGVIVSVMAVSKGSATVTVTATDTDGSAATQSFAVTVPNRAPLPAGRLEAETLGVDEEMTLVLAGIFSDPDGDELRFEAVSSDTEVVSSAVVDGSLVLSGRGRGTATVTITASDDEGLSTGLALGITVIPGNDPPLVTERILPRTIPPGERLSLSLDIHFHDPDGNPLSYRAVSSNTSVVTATVSGSVLQLQAGSLGSATVTVTARDPDGLTVSQDVSITVSYEDGGSNLPPLAVGDVPPQQLEERRSSNLDLSAYFSDPNDDPLEYSATSSNIDVVAVSVSGSALELDAKNPGIAEVSVNAEDPEGLRAEMNFAMTVLDEETPNLAPVPGTIPEQALKVGESETLDASAYFTDPNGDDLLFSAESSDAGVVTATISGTHLQLVAVAKGDATVTVTAEDPEGLSASTAFSVTVKRAERANRPPRVTRQPSSQTFLNGASWGDGPWFYFYDPDHKYAELDYAVESSNPSVLSVVRTRPNLHRPGFRMTAHAEGQATITIVVTDPEGLSASVSAVHTVGNTPPYVKNEPNDVTRSPGAIEDTYLRSFLFFYYVGLFGEDDIGDSIADFDVSSSNSSVATAEIRDDALAPYMRVTAVSVGSATITATATDTLGLSTTVTFVITVEQ